MPLLYLIFMKKSPFVPVASAAESIYTDTVLKAAQPRKKEYI